MSMGSAHFYTASAAERDTVIDLYPDIFDLEGMVWFAHLSGSEYPDSQPVYRFLNKTLGSVHFYTISEEEKDTVIANYPDIFEYEGVAYYAYSSEKKPIDAMPVYRFLNKTLGSAHFYTMSEAEKDAVIANYPDVFQYEGVAYYAFDRPSPTDNDGDGYYTDDGDCNDENSDIYPGNIEVCSDGVDNNCNDLIDEGCGAECSSNGECGVDEFCNFSDCSELTGTCLYRPEACITLYDSVCGCDGNTYGNECDAAAAGVSIDYQGECSL